MTGFRSMIQDFGLAACPPILPEAPKIVDGTSLPVYQNNNWGYNYTAAVGTKSAWNKLNDRKNNMDTNRKYATNLLSSSPPSTIAGRESSAFSIYEDGSDVSSVHQVPLSCFSDSESENCPPTPCPKSKKPKTGGPSLLEQFIQNNFRFVENDHDRQTLDLPKVDEKSSTEKVDEYLNSMDANDSFVSEFDFFNFHDSGVLMRNVATGNDGSPSSDLIDFSSPLEVNTVYVENATRGNNWKSPIWYSGSAFYSGDENAAPPAVNHGHDSTYDTFVAMCARSGHVPRRPFNGKPLATTSQGNNSAHSGLSHAHPHSSFVTPRVFKSVGRSSVPAVDAFSLYPGMPSLPSYKKENSWAALERQALADSTNSRVKHSRFFSAPSMSVAGPSKPVVGASAPVSGLSSGLNSSKRSALATFPSALNVHWEPSPAEVLQSKMEAHNIRASEEVCDEIFEYEWDDQRETLVGPILVRSQAAGNV